MELETPNNIDEEFDRYVPPNPYNYSKLQLEKRENEIEKFMKEYPKESRTHIEWVVDLIHQRPIEETRRMINSGELDKPTHKYGSPNGGTIEGAITVEDAPTAEESTFQIESTESTD